MSESITDRRMRELLEASEGCPPPEAYLEAEAATRSSAEQRRLDLHADECPACSAERALARAFDADPMESVASREDVAAVVAAIQSPTAIPRAAASRGSGAGASGSTARRVWALAAAAVVVGALALTVLPDPAPPVLPHRSGDATVRGLGLATLGGEGDLDEFPERLRWEPAIGASRYRVRILAVDDAILHESVTETQEFPLNPELLGRLHRAVVYVWQVDALDPAGATIGASERVRFRVRPAPGDDHRPGSTP